MLNDMATLTFLDYVKMRIEARRCLKAKKPIHELLEVADSEMERLTKLADGDMVFKALMKWSYEDYIQEARTLWNSYVRYCCAKGMEREHRERADSFFKRYSLF